MIRLYHGTNMAALQGIQREGEFKPIFPLETATVIAHRYGLSRDRLINDVAFEFSRHRATDRNIYFAGEKSTADRYAMGAGEVITDALTAAYRLLGKEAETVTRESTQRRPDWIAAEVRAYYQPVVLTLDVPEEKFVKEHLRHVGKMSVSEEELVELFKASPWVTVIMQPAIPASWIIHQEAK